MTAPDVFREAREKFTVADVLRMLGHPGDWKDGAHRSPFREDRHPSFSVFGAGRRWKDHATDEGGDVVELVKTALGTDYAETRRWLAGHLGIADAPAPHRTAPPRRPPPEPAPEKPKVIAWPARPAPGNSLAWARFADAFGIRWEEAWFLVRAGILRFLEIDGRPCFAVTDTANRAGEIRRIDGQPFRNGRKAFPLRGVDKSHPVGLAPAPGTIAEPFGVFVCEGATDLLAAHALRLRWHFSGGKTNWLPVAFLGAACRRLHPEAEEMIRGRRVRLCFDADDAGRNGRDHWAREFSAFGCAVDFIDLPEGSDIRDALGAGAGPAEFFACESGRDALIPPLPDGPPAFQ